MVLYVIMINPKDRDKSPIEQQWINDYCVEFLKIADALETGVLRDAVLRRVECVMDLVESWQVRNIPIDKRK